MQTSFVEKMELFFRTRLILLAREGGDVELLGLGLCDHCGLDEDDGQHHHVASLRVNIHNLDR